MLALLADGAAWSWFMPWYGDYTMDSWANDNTKADWNAIMNHDFVITFGERQWDIMDNYSKMNNSGGHKLGGYAFFAQQDPRYRLGDMELLFQLDW